MQHNSFLTSTEPLIRHFGLLASASQPLPGYPRSGPALGTPLLAESQPNHRRFLRFSSCPTRVPQQSLPSTSNSTSTSPKIRLRGGYSRGAVSRGTVAGPSSAKRNTLSCLLRILADNIKAMFNSLSGSNCMMTVGESCDRRSLLLASSIALSLDTFQNATVNHMALASEFADSSWKFCGAAQKHSFSIEAHKVHGLNFVEPLESFALSDTFASREPLGAVPALRGKDYGKTKMHYPDYTETRSGLQFKDLIVGNGPKPMKGETVVVDWDGYTIGYYGRIFEARNKTKGGSFEGEDKGFFKFKLGSQQVIPAFEEAINGMSLGGIRRIIVPPELGYPDNDFNKLGPKPTTFSGQRALDFVLRNQGLIDKTLLFDIELIRIISN